MAYALQTNKEDCMAAVASALTEGAFTKHSTWLHMAPVLEQLARQQPQLFFDVVGSVQLLPVGQVRLQDDSGLLQI